MDHPISSKNLLNKHIMALDYGKKFTGLATYKYKIDPFPLARGRINYSSDEQLIQEVSHIIQEDCIDILVIGVPFFVDGKESTMTKTVKSFVTKAKEQLQVQIYTVDETLTTFEAKERMKNDPKYNFQVDLTKIDELSAAIILEQFLKNSSDEI